MHRNVIVGSGPVIGIKYNEGVMLVASTLACYGSSKMFGGISRFHVIGAKSSDNKNGIDANMISNDDIALIEKISSVDLNDKVEFYPNAYTVISSTGEYSDFQYLIEQVEEKSLNDFYNNTLKGPKEYSNFISNLHYEKRNKMKPLYNQIVIAGLQKNISSEFESYLSIVDQFGTLFFDDYVGSGSSGYYGVSLIRQKYVPGISKDQAKSLLEECMRNIFYLECTGSRMLQFVTITLKGTTIYPAYPVETTWKYENYMKPQYDRHDYVGF
ncbi:proteasome subunit beta type 4 precursor, putative [Cryptosporidium muris RN66]|uniref:Proteasome subunit beta type 4, putative n=1 Tax=Cryptosporidium muris (strain RN66) TaxID=441375 RepID=B6ACJ2_CRYMR|nr:proteasome subunit beta type 4 precursor, putative [Cryptosporidium muris RN66]EEA05846.1 proteasome subunit beta type 4 precursor, putative [Cryptosporidium muris RN66]|eukprot:XP_002140195.1 proteasome subunit beta type 4 precursor [Cryptosporidium muris RN66]